LHVRAVPCAVLRVYQVPLHVIGKFDFCIRVISPVYPAFYSVVGIVNLSSSKRHKILHATDYGNRIF
ncbi:MAG: hypothetical protein K2G55_17695, partial [Lachnospiraceae bacterium]|nr:hypothetical protein [Lachnospiraceae bacterium]